MFLIADIGNTHSKFALYNSSSKKIYNLQTFQTNSIYKSKKFFSLIKKK